MARYPANSYARRKGPGRWPIYSILAAAIVVALLLLLSGKDEPAESPLFDDAGLEQEAVSSGEEIIAPEPIASVVPKPALEPEPALTPEPVGRAGVSEISEPPGEPNSQTVEVIREAIALINANPPAIIEARDKLNDILLMPLSGQERAFVKQRLSELSEKWLFDRNVLPDDRFCTNYRVRPGDLLSTIGDRFKVPYEILMELNNIRRPETLQAGQIIKVINGPFHARIYRSTFTLDLYLQNTFVRSFTVGLGKPGMETPTGLWLVKPGGKLIKPRWRDPVSGKTYESEDPDYPLGSRWIALEGLKGSAIGRTGIAIHGTKDPPEGIGAADSQGCIRLHNGDAILMYTLLMTGFSQVEVVE